MKLIRAYPLSIVATLCLIVQVVLMVSHNAEATKVILTNRSGGSGGAPIGLPSACSVTWSAVSGGLALGTVASEICTYQVNGKWLNGLYSLDVGNGSSGSGIYLITVPGGNTIDTTRVKADTACELGVVGSVHINQSGTRGIGTLHVYDSTHFCIITTANSATLAPMTGSYFGFADGKSVSFTMVNVPIL